MNKNLKDKKYLDLIFGEDGEQFLKLLNFGIIYFIKGKVKKVDFIKWLNIIKMRIILGIANY